MIYAIAGSKPVAGCEVHPSRCWVCGAESERTMDRLRWMGANFVGQNRVRCPSSDRVCEACVSVMSGRPPDTMRMYSHLVEGERWQKLNKGHKPAMREFLRGPHPKEWFAAIADSGQKHIIPWCPRNAPNQAGGAVLFEEQIVVLPKTHSGWMLIDHTSELLTVGATKEEVASGDYSARAWAIAGVELQAFEARYSGLRGGAWFGLAVWLAQRDEARVLARMEAEKEAKRGAKQRGKRAVVDTHGAGRARRAKGVLADAGVQHAQALGATHGQNASGDPTVLQSGGVGYDAYEDAASASAVPDNGALALRSGGRRTRNGGGTPVAGDA